MARTPLHQRIRLYFRDVGRVARAAAIAKVILVLCILPVAQTFADEQPAARDKPFKPVIGGKFDEALEQPLGLVWTDESLRSGLLRLANARQVSILLDRRIDPETKVSIEVQRVPLRELIRTIAAQQGLGVSFVNNVIYIGPITTTLRLRTVIEQQADQLIAGVSSSNKPPLPVQQRRSLQWEDLDRPADLIASIAEQSGLQIEGLASVPHDLWAAGSIPNATPTEMLLLILSQFDLSIEWQPKTWAARIVPLPKSAAIERTYDLKTRVAELTRDWHAAFDEIEIQVKGTKATVRATVEQHEEIAASLRQTRPVTRPTSPKTGGTKAVTFTFEIKSAPLVDVMKAIEKQSSYVFEYDAKELQDAGVKLDRRLDLKMTKASPAELFHAMFDDSQILFEFEGQTVKLKPKSR